MKILFSTLFISLSILSFSQENNSLLRFGLNSDYNIEFLSNEVLNNYLVNKQYYSSSNIINSMSLGFSIRASDTPSMIKVKFIYGESMKDKSQDKSVLYSTGFGFDYLYDIVKREAWVVAPYIGINLRNYKLIAVSENSISALTSNYIEEALQINNKSLVNFGVQFDKNIKIYYLNIYLGLKGGYNIDFITSDWNNSSGQKMDDIPNVNLSGFNAGFSLKIEFNEEH